MGFTSGMKKGNLGILLSLGLLISLSLLPIGTSLNRNSREILNMSSANRWLRVSITDKKLKDPPDVLQTRLTFEEQSCTDLLMKESTSTALRYSDEIYMEESSDTNQALLSNFTDLTSGYSLCVRDVGSVPDTNVCAIPESWKCDNYSSCLTDECGCHGDETFKCADGSGCIALHQVCDSRPDCPDVSDECACHEFRSCLRPIRLKDGSHYEDCYKQPACSEIRNTMINTPDFVKFKKQLMDGKKNGKVSVSRLALCQDNDSPFNFHCNLLQIQPKRTLYECSENSSIASTYALENEFPFMSHSLVFCDGVMNCRNGVDEENCPQMFYCKSDQKAVAKQRTCDSIPDCSDFSDECDDCAMSSIYSSQADLIEHTSMLTVFYVEIFGIICLNFYAFLYHCRRMRGNETYWVDIVQCLTMLLYNVTTAAYLVIICWQRWQLRGVYCLHDLTWRSSFLCKITGALAYAASRGTLQSVVIATVFRFVHRCKVGNERRVKLVHYLPVFLVANLYNIAMAFSPLLGLLYNLPGWTKVFTHEYIFQNNPLIRRGNKSDLELLVSVYHKLYLDMTENLSPSDLLAQLQNLTSSGELFSPDRVTIIGLYGASPLCFPDVLTTEHPMWRYKAVFMAENTVCLTVLIVSFTFISREFLKSRTAIGPGVEHSQEEQDRTHCFFLSFKFWVVVGSQLLTWLPVQGALIAGYVGPGPSKSNTIKIIDVLAANIIPLNAIMNPILHTDMAERLLPCLQEILIKLITCFIKPPCLHLIATQRRGVHQVDMTSVTELELNGIKMDPLNIDKTAGASMTEVPENSPGSSEEIPASESGLDDAKKMELIFRIMECR